MGIHLQHAIQPILRDVDIWPLFGGVVPNASGGRMAAMAVTEKGSCFCVPQSNQLP